MAKLTTEMKEAIGQIKVFHLATASKDGVPNVAPMGSVFLIDDETLFIGDNFMKKTIANVLENPKAAVLVFGGGVKGCFQIKADVIIENEGHDFEEMKKKIQAMKPTLNPKHLLRLKITDIFECMPGPNAGNKMV